ncbi:hypothetical protein KFE25_009364 [Diacronema lutheri]|uniref:Prolyl endopeptidase n=2 Tax=Diacronema lutheri TaxID=2081491 RepID=A0A8J5XMJ1_DIALT|nr:hypothetical protein KFE25_009364 [Diacronema lutheri]
MLALAAMSSLARGAALGAHAAPRACARALASRSGAACAAPLPGAWLSPRAARLGARAAAGVGVAAAVAAGAGAASAEPSAPGERVAYWQGRQGEHAWLEDVLGERALAWVRAHNERTLRALGDPTGTPTYERILEILTSKDKIPYISKVGELYYNFWQDKENKRGLLRRTTLASYESGSPEWETVLSVDALCAAEGESWVYKGSTPLDEGEGVAPTRTLLHLSRGGADATVVREFDLVALRFVPAAEGGFELPEAKSSVGWQSRDVLLVGTDFGAGSLTDSGYPRTVREWRRGTPLAAAAEVYAGEFADVSVRGYRTRHCAHAYEWRTRSPNFYTSKKALRAVARDGRPGPWLSLDGSVPDDAIVRQFRDQLLVQLRSEWRGHAAGSLLAARIDEIAWDPSGGPGGRALAEAQAAPLTPIFEPSERTALDGVTRTRTKLVLTVLDNVKTRVLSLGCADDGAWACDQADGVEPLIGGRSISAVDADAGDDVWLTEWTHLTPHALKLGSVAAGVGGLGAARQLRQLPPMFDASGLCVRQGFATSKDGTLIPYFVIRRDGVTEAVPTLLYGYGGFEISLTPNYMSSVGAAWLQKGGCFVEANIRGGGEFGPTWHRAALKENRNKAYEDFEAVAEHLIATGVTTREQLACRGGSNGGLLVGNAVVRRPDLWGAVVCAVPLLDMRRFNKLLAGASWMAEYGDPDTSDWSFLSAFSPYHNIDRDASYPPMLLTTSTRDDRVHPYHARAFVARLEEAGVCDELLYYENIEGGHGGAADPKQQAFMMCLYVDFLRKTIGKGFFQA